MGLYEMLRAKGFSKRLLLIMSAGGFVAIEVICVIVLMCNAAT